jgi:hypothetical protein
MVTEHTRALKQKTYLKIQARWKADPIAYAKYLEKNRISSVKLRKRMKMKKEWAEFYNFRMQEVIEHVELDLNDITLTDLTDLV